MLCKITTFVPNKPITTRNNCEKNINFANSFKLRRKPLAASRVFDMHVVALQNAAFCLAKPCILEAKMLHFAAQNHAFCNALISNALRKDHFGLRRKQSFLKTIPDIWNSTMRRNSPCR